MTNLWVNRMIGDRQPDAPKQYTFTRPVFYKADSPLLPLGAAGPVRVVQAVADKSVLGVALTGAGPRLAELKFGLCSPAAGRDFRRADIDTL